MPGAHVAGWSRPDLTPAEAGQLWSRSGAAWLTAPDVATPTALVAETIGLVRHVDARIDDPAKRLGSVVAADGVGLLAERAASIGFGPSGAISCGGGTRLLPAHDGWFAITLARDDDIDLVPAWLELDGIRRGDHWGAVEQVVARRPVAELRERGVLLGLPCAVVGEVGRVQEAVRGPAGEPETLRRGAPGSGSGVLVDRIADRAATSLDGLIVLNLASLWAGPLAADVLARLGARVITVESTERPDGSRATLRFFESLHGRTESVALPFTRAEGWRRLADLVATADVVIEGSRPRALAQLGLDAAQCVRDGVRVWVSITGHGRRSPAAERVAFGDDAAAAGGLVGWVDGSPRFVADAVADPLSGLTAAATVVDLVEAGVGALVDVALARVAASCAGSAEGAPPVSRAHHARPRPRTDAGAPLPLGRDTSRVLADLDIR